MMLTLVGKLPRNFRFDDIYSHKRYQSSDERIAKNALKAISERNQNVLVYDFASLTLRKVSKVFFEDEEIRLSKSQFSNVLRENIQSERLKGTIAIVLKIKPRDNDVVDVFDAIDVADHHGFSRVSVSTDCLEYRLSLTQDPNRE